MEGMVSERGLLNESFDDDSLEFFASESSENEEPRLSRFKSRPFVWVANKKPESAKYFSPNSVENFQGIPLIFKGKDGKPFSESDLAELEMVKERLSKLLLGEDMSGSGNGVQTALAISNAITNLSASVFAQLWRLEPLSQIKKSMWRREFECFLCVTDYIVVLTPSWHTFPDGSRVETMSSGPRSDLAANLPALRKLDSMLLEILDCFVDTEFWYVEKGLESPKADAEETSFSSTSLQNQEERWWLPVPQVPSGGLSDVTRRMLQNKRDCAKQILKAVIAINNMTLSEMEVPESYFESLPKHAKDCLGERMYRYIASHRFSSERLVAALGISSDHQALEIANQVEASIFLFRKRTSFKDLKRFNSQLSSKNSWELVKELALDGHKLELLANRAESLLLCLKQRFPGLPQTTLDSLKIQHNQDIGKSVLESYSRVLESLAFNILARIDDVLYADDIARKPDQKNESFLSKDYAITNGTVPENNTSVTPPNTNTKMIVAKKTTLMSHIPSLQSYSLED